MWADTLAGVALVVALVALYGALTVESRSRALEMRIERLEERAE